MTTSLLRMAMAAILGATLTLPSVGHARTLDEILSSKKIAVGVNPALPPLGMYNEKNEMDGFDVEFARKIAELLGVELELVKVSANDRIPFLASGK